MIEKIKKEIQRQLQESKERLSHINARGMVAPNEEQLIVHLEGLLSFINTLEVKEKDLDLTWEDIKILRRLISTKEINDGLFDKEDYEEVLKHFKDLKK